MSDAAAHKTQDERKDDSPVRNAILNQKSGILAEDTLNRRVIQKKNNGPRYGLSQDISHRASGVFRMTTTKNLLQNTPQAVDQHKSNYLLKNRAAYASNAITNINSPNNLNSPGNIIG